MYRIVNSIAFHSRVPCAPWQRHCDWAPCHRRRTPRQTPRTAHAPAGASHDSWWETSDFATSVCSPWPASLGR